MRGPGFWKLNTSLLTEIDYVNQIRTVIKDTQEEYKNDRSVDDALMWEIIKLKIRELSLKYSAIKKPKCHVLKKTSKKKLIACNA